MTCPNCGAQLDAGVLNNYSHMIVGSLKCAGCGHSFSAGALRVPSTPSHLGRERETSTAAVVVGTIILSFFAALIVERLWLIPFGLLAGALPLPATVFPMTHWIFAAIAFLIWFFTRDRSWMQGIAVWLGGYFVGSVINSIILIAIWPDAWAESSKSFPWLAGVFLLVGGVLLWLGFSSWLTIGHLKRTALKDSDEYYLRGQAIESLGRLGGARAIAALVELLRASEQSVRTKAAEALVRIGDEQAIKSLIAALNDSKHYVRYEAAEALGEIGNKRAVEPLISVLGDSDWFVRGKATEALGRIRDAQAIEPLITALEDSDEHVREYAAVSLGQIGDARAVEPLINVLEDSYDKVREHAALALGELGDKHAVEPLIAALKDSDDTVRASAAWALGEIGDERAVKPLILLLSDSDDYVGQEAKKALERISAESPEVAKRLSDELKPLDRLWHAQEGSQISGLVSDLSAEETNEVVASIDLAGVPLNAFCTDAFNYKGLDARMVAAMHLAYRLLEVGRDTALEPLLVKITAKFKEKLRVGAKRKGPSFESKDSWLIGEDLMIKMESLAIALLKKSDPKMDSYAVSIFEALLLDYPQRLESHFWLAATRHNLYMQNKNSDTKTRAVKAIEEFLVAAKGHSDYQSNVAALQNLIRTEY